MIHVVGFAWCVTLTVVSRVCSLCILTRWLIRLKVGRSIILGVFGPVGAPAGAECRLVCVNMADS
jgi:hypothetical protein